MRGVPGSGDASCGDADPERTGHGEGDRSGQGSGHDASGDRDLLHLHRLSGRLLFQGVVAQGVSRDQVDEWSGYPVYDESGSVAGPQRTLFRGSAGSIQVNGTCDAGTRIVQRSQCVPSRLTYRVQ